MIVSETPAARKSIQASLYRDQILRARAMTPEERLDEVFELSNYSFGLMLDGAMDQLGTNDPGKGWELVEQQLTRLKRFEDRHFYQSVPAHPPTP